MDGAFCGGWGRGERVGFRVGESALGGCVGLVVWAVKRQRS